MRTLKDFLKTAIKAENCIQKLYEHGRDKVKNPATRKFLDCLVKEEKQHQDLLASILQNKIYDLKVEIPNDKVFEQAEAAFGEVEEKCTDDWTIEQILNIALERKYHAQKQYELIGKNCKIPEMTELLQSMAEEEKEHRFIIEREYKIVTHQMGYEF